MPPATASPSSLNAENAAVVEAISTSSPRMFPACKYCDATVSSVSPVNPRRVLMSATVVPTVSMSAGIAEAILLVDSFRLSKASPVAPVPIRIVSYASSNDAPIPQTASAASLSLSIPTVATIPPANPAIPALNVDPKPLPDSSPASRNSCSTSFADFSPSTSAGLKAPLNLPLKAFLTLSPMRVKALPAFSVESSAPSVAALASFSAPLAFSCAAL